MIFTETKLKGVFIIEPTRLNDERGFFARTWCRDEFEAQGLNTSFVQANVAFNIRRGTLRGMHYQSFPHEETKLIRCTKGAIYDVIIDIRKNSPTYRKWVAVELTAYNYRMLYVAEGFAHGYQTLQDDTEVSYQVSQFYAPNSGRGVRWDDPGFNIKWPETEKMIISEKDRSWRTIVNFICLD
jgi:dTDP-4-dehydrorhamnose 3,5-epimerase